jgi:hypothetical protein
MVRDTACSSHLHIVSCYDGIEDSSTAELMKRPLITATQSRIDASSLEAEQQQQIRLKGKEGPVWQAFFLGSAIGCALQVIVFATCFTIFKIWGENPTFTGPLSLVSYCVLVILSVPDIAIFIGICCLTFFYSRSKSGSLDMRKKLDQDVDTPAGSNSIWTERMLFVVGIYFLFGCHMGTWCSRWIIGDVPLMQLLTTVVVYFVLVWILIKCLDWEHSGSGEEQEEEEEHEECSFFV